MLLLFYCMKLTPNATSDGMDVIEPERNNPYELIDLCLQYDMDAFSHLFDYYIKVFLGIYREYRLDLCRLTRSEWLSESASVLWECIFRYRPDLQVLFSALLRQSLGNRACSLQRSYLRKQDPQYGHPLSLDQMLEENPTFGDPAQKDSVHDSVLNHLQLEHWFDMLKSALTSEELQVVSMLYQGFKKSEVARILGLSKYQVNRAVIKSRQVLLVDTQYRD